MKKEETTEGRKADIFLSIYFSGRQMFFTAFVLYMYILRLSKLKMECQKLDRKTSLLKLNFSLILG